MSKFQFHKVEDAASRSRSVATRRVGAAWSVVFDGKTLGTVAQRGTHVAWFIDGDSSAYPTRQAAAERLLLHFGVRPVAWAALPADPFDGIAVKEA